ncbi:glutathione S-transferase family protein [Epibacterium ulvae]|uniref:Glutathione S-transferase n=1 Tax=Epibacterium ulvae TaxID=1156985 RepID=A0A1G5R2S3_9RHOB|nr:glutathione S-transferase [Epibacterium ulvae]SCZ67751.1 Glutathione S-transferase [Epibacterium ulvae]
MKIYEFEGFPNPARVRIALAEKGLTDKVEFISVNVPEGEHQSEAFRAKNPSAAVPLLELEDGTCISECTAITEYLDHLDGNPTLTGGTPKERAVIHMMQRRAESGLLDAVGTYFHHATPGLGKEIEGYQCAEWGNHQKEVALKGMRYLDGLLADRPYLAGENFSMADITAFAGLGFAGFASIDVPEDCANLKDWQARVAARPSIAA